MHNHKEDVTLDVFHIINEITYNIVYNHESPYNQTDHNSGHGRLGSPHSSSLYICSIFNTAIPLIVFRQYKRPHIPMNV